MPTVWFIRHGESISNANLPTTHPATSELTAKGHAEAAQIVAAFDKRPDLLAVSPYKRAVQTAAPTIAHFASIPQETWPVHEFTYLAPSHYANTTGNQRRPLAVAYWERNDPWEKDGGEGESFAELMGRIAALKERIRTHSALFIAIFSHGLFVRALVWSLLTGRTDASADAMRRYSDFVRSVSMPNGSIFKLNWHRNGRSPTFSGFGTAHLQ